MSFTSGLVKVQEELSISRYSSEQCLHVMDFVRLPDVVLSAQAVAYFSRKDGGTNLRRVSPNFHPGNCSQFNYPCEQRILYPEDHQDAQTLKDGKSTVVAFTIAYEPKRANFSLETGTNMSVETIVREQSRAADADDCDSLRAFTWKGDIRVEGDFHNGSGVLTVQSRHHADSQNAGASNATDLDGVSVRLPSAGSYITMRCQAPETFHQNGRDFAFIPTSTLSANPFPVWTTRRPGLRTGTPLIS